MSVWIFKCYAWRRKLSRMAAGTLPEALAELSRNHLRRCENCREYYQTLEQTTGALKQWVDQTQLAEPGEELRNRWRQAVLSASRDPNRPAIADESTWGQRRIWRPLALASLACVWFMILLFNLTTPSTSDRAIHATASPKQLIMVLKDRPLSSSAQSETAKPRERSLPGAAPHSRYKTSGASA